MGWLIPSIGIAAANPIAPATITKNYSEKKQPTALESENTFYSLVERAWDIIFLIRFSDGQILKTNKAAVNAYGYSENELLGMTIMDIRHPATLKEIHTQLEDAYQQGIHFETIHQTKAGKALPVEVSSSGIYINNEFILMSIVRDISERKRLQQQEIYNSTHDPMTGIYNRRSFDKEIEHIDAQGTSLVGMMVLDVDGLKQINDTMGHKKGDECIMHVVNIIHKCFPNHTKMYRIGGDEFVLIFDDCPLAIFEESSQKIHSAFEELSFNGNNLLYKASIGFSFCPDGTKTATELFQEADQNMYKEKLSKSEKRRCELNLWHADEIPFELRLLALIESYDAMAHEQAMEELSRIAGTKLNHQQINQFHLILSSLSTK